MPKPLIILVPGSFTLPALYKAFLTAVRQRGQDIEALPLLSAGVAAGEGRDGLPTMYDDAALVAKEVEKHADQGRDIILLPHSYGGIPVTESIKGLSKQERMEQGKAGGVTDIAYMTCLVPEEGGTAQTVLAAMPNSDAAMPEIDEKGWMLNADPERVAKSVAQTRPLEEAIAFVEKMPKHSSASFMTPLRYEGFKDVNVSYLLCEQDRCILPAIQKAGIRMIECKSGRKVDVTSVPFDHFAPQSAEKQTVDWILSIAKKMQEREQK